MRKKIKVIPRKSETLCKRCIHAKPPFKIVACLFTQTGSPCMFFKRELPSLQIGDFKITNNKYGLNFMYIGNNEREANNNENKT